VFHRTASHFIARTDWAVREPPLRDSSRRIAFRRPRTRA
jgi:hypothetical protein